MEGGYEHIWMHVTTTGGETYSLDLDVRYGFNPALYLTQALSEHRLLKVAPDTYISENVISKVTFTRMEVH